METVKVTINGKECLAEKGKFLIDIAKDNRIGIPHLCHHESLRGLNACRLCIVEVTERGKTRIVTSCTFPAMSDLTVETNTEKLKSMRKMLLALLRAETPDNMQVTKLIKAFGAADSSRFEMNKGNDCVMCGLCAKACEEVGCFAISTVNRGTTKKIATPYETASDTCIGCGSCVYVCPTECIKMEDKDGVRNIWGKDFKMLKCSCCNEYFITEEYYEHVKGKLENQTDDLICPHCKKEEFSRKMIDVFL